MKLFCITLTLPIFSFAQVTVPTSGQCQAFCLKEYALFKEFILLNGNSYQDVEVSNNTDFSLCKLGCHSPGFNDLTLPAFKKGQLAYENIIEHSSNAPLTQSPVRSVSLLCFDSFLNGTMFGRLLFELEKRAASQFYVHYVEGVQLIHAETLMERVFWQAWSYASSIDFTTMLKLSNSSIQFRVTSFTVEGIVGIMAKSQWYEEPHFKNSFSRSVGIVVKHQAWRDDLASTELAFITSPDHVPTCSLVLAYHSHSGQEQRIEFIMVLYYF
uniref:Dirigent protein n=1 Tax=Heterorhabditis bacteriophora TaxID=37862 RepID=A0A1I7XF07_HETBA